MNWTTSDPPRNPLIETEAATSGRITVGQLTDLQYQSENGLLHVFGDLGELDHTHEIDFTTSNFAVTLLARELVSLNQSLPTRVLSQANALVWAHQMEGFYGAGLLGDVFTSATLHAYSGTPSTLPGDFNVDGSVDAADYVMWRANVGQPFLPNSESLNVVASDHYDLWRQNFGATAGAGSTSSVPESSATSIALVLLVLISLSRQYRFSHRIAA